MALGVDNDNSLLRLAGIKEAAGILGWSPRKASTYYGRGKLPAPIAVLACGPIWHAGAIEALLVVAKRDAQDQTRLEREGKARQLTLLDTAAPQDPEAELLRQIAAERMRLAGLEEQLARLRAGEGR